MGKIEIGLDIFSSGLFKKYPIGKSPGLLCNQASVSTDLRHSIDILCYLGIDILALFGPQHGPYGTDQANMVEWEGQKDARTNLPFYSLYGKTRKPTQQMLSGLSSLIVDLQDVGARYYTYIWTTLLCLRAVAEFGIPLIILDRPNPIGGEIIEGNCIEENFVSFVGLKNIPIRHACTIGELLRLFAKEERLEDYLFVVPMKGWRREMFWSDTGLFWVSPSPNIPDPETAILYPGACLLEGTNISEGRGTALPFKMFGAPWIDPFLLKSLIDRENHRGVIFRPGFFKPTFDKYMGEICGGLQVHITDAKIIKPIGIYYSIIRTIFELWSDNFRWATPPYEYEFEKPPIDILWGSKNFRNAIENCISTGDFLNSCKKYEEEFLEKRRPFLLYG